jgi:hypothetical protein
MLLATTGQHGRPDIARIAGSPTGTFALGLKKFLSGGMEALLRRQSPSGLTSPIAEAKVQQQSEPMWMPEIGFSLREN